MAIDGTYDMSSVRNGVLVKRFLPVCFYQYWNDLSRLKWL